TLVRTQRSAVYDQGRLRMVVLIGEFQLETPPLGKVYLVGSQGELPPDRAPYLYIDLGPVECGLIRHLDIRGIGPYQHIPHQGFRFLPKLWLIDILLTQLAGLMHT